VAVPTVVLLGVVLGILYGGEEVGEVSGVSEVLGVSEEVKVEEVIEGNDDRQGVNQHDTLAGVIPIQTQTRVELPEEVRGIYWTAVTAGYESNREYLLNFMLDAGLNAVVIDLKLDNGQLGFVPENEEFADFVQSNPVMEDFDETLEWLGENGIYRIARIAVMRDGAYAVQRPDSALRWSGGSYWTDSIGSLWIDPAYEPAWDYNLELAREAYDRGFDEIQFDYVRFASDGSISSIVYPEYDGALESKNEVMARFFKHVGGTLRDEGIPVSFDVFGMTCHSNTGFNIGQRLTDVYPYADFISPMVYPSHYEWNFRGLGNPSDYPYAVITASLTEGIELMVTEMLVENDQAAHKLRPWLQDFDLGAVYDIYRIQEQIRATRDAGASGWIMWNARNVYEEPAYYNLDSNGL
jgi:hypothetical protein